MKLQKLALIVASLSLTVASTACSSSGGGLRLDGSSAPDDSSADSPTSQGAAGCVYSRDSSNSQALAAECRAAASAMPAGCSAQMEYSSRSPECQTAIANAAAAQARRNLAR